MDKQRKSLCPQLSSDLAVIRPTYLSAFPSSSDYPRCLHSVYPLLNLANILFFASASGHASVFLMKTPWSTTIDSTKAAPSLKQVSVSVLTNKDCIYIFENYFFKFILHPDLSFPSLLSSQSLPPPPLCPSPIQSSVSFHKRAGLPRVSTKHGISSCSKTKHLPM